MRTIHEVKDRHSGQIVTIYGPGVSVDEGQRATGPRIILGDAIARVSADPKLAYWMPPSPADTIGRVSVDHTRTLARVRTGVAGVLAITASDGLRGNNILTIGDAIETKGTPVELAQRLAEWMGARDTKLVGVEKPKGSTPKKEKADADVPGQ